MSTPPASADCPASPSSAQARIERLEREIAQRDDLLAIAAHELRNPLHALSLQLTLARTAAQGNGERDTAARLAKAHEMLMRYSNRVTLLMELIRSNQNAHPLNLQRVDLSVLLAGVADALQQDARFRGVALRTSLPAHCPARVDPLLVEQVVDNLLINAFKHAGASTVELRLRTAPDGEICIDIADDGRGIAVEDQARIFGKFGVAELTERGTGTGLGLWIVRRLATALGGSVTLESRAGHGATFTFHIPLPAYSEP